MSKELIRLFVQDLLAERLDDAQNTLHVYLAEKAQDLIEGLSTDNSYSILSRELKGMQEKQAIALLAKNGFKKSEAGMPPKRYPEFKNDHAGMFAGLSLDKTGIVYAVTIRKYS